jgi:hypothetical protein
VAEIGKKDFFDTFEKVLFLNIFVVRMSLMKYVNFDQFWPILAIFYEFKSRFEKCW